MKASCVLTEGDIRNLYITASAGMNEALSKGEEFDPQTFMQMVFDMYEEDGDPVTGALFIQQLPTIIGTIAIKPSMRGLKLNKTIDLADLRDDFLDPISGIDNVLKMFNAQADPAGLKELVNIQQGSVLNDPNEQKPVQGQPVRLAAYSPYGLTMQMFKARKPSDIGESEIQQLDETKDRIYNTLYNIKQALPEGFTAMDDVIYQGKNLVLAPYRLTDLPQDQLDKYAVDRIKKSAAMKKGGYGKKGVTEANEMIAMVLFDKNTNTIVMFDEDGNVGDVTNGKLVYQFLRDTRIENGKYRVTDIYGIDDQVISPKQIVDNQIAESEMTEEEFEKMLNEKGQSIKQLIAEIEAEQQVQFKTLYDIKQNVLAGNAETFTITGISEGLNMGYVTKNIPFNELTNIPGVSNAVYQTLNIIKSPRDGFGKSQAVITIGDREFAVNRPNMDDNLINKIIAVLTNPKITDNQKYIYVSQFTANLDYEVQRHSINYDKAKGVISFWYRPYTMEKAVTEKLDNKPVKLDLTKPEAKDIIENALRYAYRKNGEYQTSKMKFEPKLNGKTFSDYDTVSGKFVRANYTDFIKQYPAEVKFTPENKLGVFNSYIMFRPNTPFTESLNKAKEEAGDVVTSTLTFGDETPSILDTELNAKIESIGTQEQYRQYLNTIFPNSKIKDVFYHWSVGNEISTQFGDDLNRVKGIWISKLQDHWKDIVKNKSKRLNVNEIKRHSLIINAENVWVDSTLNSPEGNQFPKGYDTIAAYNEADIAYSGALQPEFKTVEDFEAVIKSKKQIHELGTKEDLDAFKRFVDQSNEVKSEADALPTSTEDFILRESVSFPVVPDVEEGIQPKETKGPENADTEVGKLFNRFKWDRSSKLPNAVTEEQIEQAKTWWSKSPLSKIISLTQLANIVNSDSFANFIINGATLADTSINIDTKNGGTMADVYHEAWHGFSQLFLTKEEKTKLYDEVKYFKDAKGNQPNRYKTYFEIEEMLAEDFRSYAMDPKAVKGAPKRNNLFRRILNFIKNIFNKVFKREQIAGDVTLVPAVKEMYDKLYLASENPSILNVYKPNVDNAMFSMLDRGVNTVDGTKSEALNFQDSAELVNSIDSIISQIIDDTYADGVAYTKQQNLDNVVSKAGAIKLLTDERNKKETYILVKERLEDRYAAIQNEIQTIKDSGVLSYELEKLEDAARILKLGLENYGDETKGLVKYHIENSTFDVVRQKFVEIDYAEEDADNLTVAEEAQTSERYGDKIVNQKSLQELASKETIYILKSLFKKDGQDFVYNKLGFKELADFTTTWNNVTRAIGGIKDRREMYSELKKAAMVFPELKQLIDYKLPDPANIKDRFEFNISASFWQDFKKPRITYIQLTAFKEGKNYELEVTEASIETSSIIRKFQNKFKADTNNPYTNRVNNVNTLDLQKVANKFARKDNKAFDSTQAFEFANAIGLYIDDLAVVRNELNYNKDYYSLQYIFGAIKQLAALENASNSPDSKITREQLKTIAEFKLDPIGVLKKGIPSGVLSDEPFKQKNIIERFAELQGKYGADSSNFSVLNAERNLVFEHIEDHTVSMIVHAINKAKTLQELWGSDKLQYMSYLNPEINSFTLRSKILNSIFEIDTNSYQRRAGKSLQLNYVSGTQIADSTEGANTTSLDIYSKFLQEMHMMLKGGLQEFMRHASKSSSFGVRVDGDIVGGMEKGDDGHLYMDVDMFTANGVGEQYAVDEFFIDYIDAELGRIQKFNGNKELFKTYTGYNRVLEYDANGEPKIYAGQVFTAFDNVLTDSTKQFIYENITDGTLRDYLENNPEFRETISSEIKNYFDAQTLQNENYLTEVNYVDPKLLNRLTGLGMKKADAVSALVKAFTYNSWIHNFETANLMYGDVVQYNHAKEEMHKRNPGSTSGGPGFLTDVDAQKFINGFAKKTSYASILSKMPEFGEKINSWQYNGTFNTAIVRDIVRKSVYIDQIREGLTKNYTERLSKTLTGEDLTYEVNRRVSKELKAYEKMEEADGQGIITFDAYRNLRLLEKNWSDKQEALFQNIAQGKSVSMDEITEFFPVYKIQNFGHLADTELPVNAMHKFALAPLIPSVIKGSDLESLHNQMMMSGIQYVTFQTGSKVGSVTADGKADQIYDDETEQKTIKKDIVFTPNVVYLEYLKNVTSVPSKFKGKTVFSTQLRKLILEGLYEQGIINIPSVAKATREYEDVVDEYSEILETQLLEEIGYEYKDGKYIGNLGDFLRVVRNELGRRAIPEHHIKFVDITENNTVKTDLSLHLEADEIEKILVSLIEKKLVKQKVKGEALVQVSSGLSNRLWNQGANFTGATEDEIRKYMGSNNLPFYNNADGKTSAMKVAIALQGDFQNLFQLKHPDNQKIEVRKPDGTVDFDASLARLNEAIKDDKWLDIDNNRKTITLTAVRIPVQGLNSMEFMEVHHFLHPSAGNIIIPPSEIVAKSGADFDVDKLTTFMPHIDERGIFKTSVDEYNNEDLKRLIDNLKKSDDPGKRAQALRLVEERKKVLENKLITSIRGILELPENYANLVRPNETYLLKDIADDLEEDVIEYDKFANTHQEGDRYTIDKEGKAKKVISPTRVFEVGYNLHKHDVNIVGKAGLSIVAIENALSPIFNALGAKMPLTYKPVYFDEARQRYVEDKYGDDYEMRLRLTHNKTPGGNISLSNILNAEGDSIADLYSHMMNGLVDVEKDAWIFFIQGNVEVIPILTYLLKAGVPKSEAINFVSQPLVREYVKQQKILGSVYSKLNNQAPDSPSFVKYEASNKAINKLVPESVLNALKVKVDAENIKNVVNILPETVKFRLKYKGTNSQGIVTELSKIMTGKEIKDGVMKSLKEGPDAVQHILAIQQWDPETEKYTNQYVKATSLVSNGNYYTAATLANTGKFEVKNMRERLSKGYPIDEKSLDMFLHFIEIEKQIKGIQALKRQANPDTKTSKTIQEIVERTVALEDLSDLSKIDPELIDKLRNESILNSFFDNQIVLDLLEPLFKLRNNKRINEYVSYAISAHASKITGKFGKGQEGVRQFINEYKNAVVNYIYQNYMTNMVNAQGQVVNVPDIYRGSQVIQTTSELKNGAVFQEGTFYINTDVLKKQFEAKTYLDSSPNPESYAKLGLKPFKTQDDPFDTFSSYLRYVMEREFIKDKFPKESMKDGVGWLKSRDYDTFVNQRALINSFNQKAIVGTEEYSFTKLVESVIREYPELKDKYPILLQLSEANSRGGEKILTLSNKALAKGDLAESYNLNLTDLADIRVQKGVQKDADIKDNIATNAYITEVFKMLPIMSIYQNGVGYSKYGINKVLPFDQFLLVIENASVNFTNRNLNLHTFDNIFDSLFTGKDYFKNYVQNPEEYNSFSPKGTIPAETVLSVPILEIDIQPAKITETAPGVGTIEFAEDESYVEAKGMIRNRLSDVLGEAPSEEFLMKLYQNYVGLMGKNEKRKDSALAYKNFVGYITNSNVIKYKDTYIFGVYEPKMNVFVSNISSSPTSKQLLAEAIPYISKNFDVIGFAPMDVASKYKRSGYEISDSTFAYNFKGERMQKHMYASNPSISMRLFGKPLNEVTGEEIKKVSERELALYAYKKLFNEIKRNQTNADKNVISEALDDLRVPSHMIYDTIRNYDKWYNKSRNPGTIDEKTGKRRDDGTLNTKLLEKNLKKLYDFKKVDIDPIGTNLLNRVVPETENELNKLLVNYLSSFGIKFEYTDMKEKLGLDSLGVADILNKIAYVQKDNTEDLPNVAGKFIAYMLQHNPIVTETYGSLRKFGKYKNASKDELLDIIGELISEQLHKKTNTEMPKSLIDKIKMIIDYFLSFINGVRLKRINRNIGIIADGVIARNKALITASYYKPGAEGKPITSVTLQPALDSDKFASDVVDRMSEYFILTGSTTAAEQGTVYRPSENQVHDLDWVSSLTRDKGKAVFEKMYPNNVYVREIINAEQDFATDTWLIAPDGYTIENIVIQGDNRKVMAYDIVDADGKVVSKYIPESDSHTGDIEAKAIDIFSYGVVTPERTAHKTMDLKSGVSLRIADWQNTFAAKLLFGRLKDIWDYNRFIPDEYIATSSRGAFIDMGEFKRVTKEDGTTADQKMRQLADGVLVESMESISSSQTSLRVVQKKIKDQLPESLKENVKAQIKGRARLVAPLANIENPVIMLARNYSLRNRPLDEPVQKALDVFMSKNASFIFGNSSTDRPFLDYLVSKNYNNFTIYGYTSGGKDNRITQEDLMIEPTEVEETPTFEKSDTEILNSVEFANFYNQEILKNTDLSVQEVLDYYKKCKLG